MADLKKPLLVAGAALAAYYLYENYAKAAPKPAPLPVPAPGKTPVIPPPIVSPRPSGGFNAPPGFAPPTGDPGVFPDPNVRPPSTENPGGNIQDTDPTHNPMFDPPGGGQFGQGTSFS